MVADTTSHYLYWVRWPMSWVFLVSLRRGLDGEGKYSELMEMLPVWCLVQGAQGPLSFGWTGLQH